MRSFHRSNGPIFFLSLFVGASTWADTQTNSPPPANPSTNSPAALEAQTNAPTAANPVAFNGPGQIIIIRHAEKPPTGNTLSPQGYQRAQALVGFFKSNPPAPTSFGPPAAIFAMAPKDEDGTLRPIETVTPLAQSLGIKIDEKYTKNELPKLVDDIVNKGKFSSNQMVLICWEHHVIPTLVQDFGWMTAPDTWADGVFDRAWVLNMNGNHVVSFQDLPQHLLPGDSTQ